MNENKFVKWLLGSSSFHRAALCTAALAVLIVLGVFFLPQKLQGVDLTNVVRPKPPAWQGVLHVWQVNTWRVGRGSRTAVVQAAIRRFETRNVGIYVELDNVNPEVLARRLRDGQKPDVLLFPDNWAGMKSDDFLTLDTSALPNLATPFAAVLAADQRAVPWMAGGQVILINNALCRSAGIEPPAADATWTTQALMEFAQKAATARKKKPVLGISGAAGAWMPLALQATDTKALQTQSLLAPNAFAAGIDGAREPFGSGRCAVLLATQWEAELMGRLAAKGKAFEFSMLPLPTDTRACLNVQYAAVYDSGEDARNGAATTFIAALLSAPVQKSIAENSGCLAVIPNATDKPADSDVDKLLRAQQATARAPLPWRTLDADRLTQALGGDRGAALVLGGNYTN